MSVILIMLEVCHCLIMLVMYTHRGIVKQLMSLMMLMMMTMINCNDTASDNCNTSLSRCWDHVLSIRCSVLFVQCDRVSFEIVILVWKCIHDVAPAYLEELCLQMENVRGR